MTRKASPEQKRRKKIQAIAFLVLMGWFAVPRFFPDEPPPAESTMTAEEADIDPMKGESTGEYEEMDLPADVPSAVRRLRELRAVRWPGSFRPGDAVYEAFGRPPVEPSAPAESDPKPDANSNVEHNEPAKADPAEPQVVKPPVRPRHRVGFVLLTANHRRAVVDGVVRGIGDTIDAGRIESIDSEGIWVRAASGERWFYRLGEGTSGEGKGSR